MCQQCATMYHKDSWHRKLEEDDNKGVCATFGLESRTDRAFRQGPTKSRARNNTWFMVPPVFGCLFGGHQLNGHFYFVLTGGFPQINQKVPPCNACPANTSQAPNPKGTLNAWLSSGRARGQAWDESRLGRHRLKLPAEGQSVVAGTNSGSRCVQRPGHIHTA